MSIEHIFYTQVATIIGFVLAVFALYRLLVSQKDAVIELLKEKNSQLEYKLKEVESQSPDALVESLAKRVDIAKTEIGRLQKDGEEYKGQLSEKEAELTRLAVHLKKVNALLIDNELLCPKCGAPLLRRDWFPIYGHYNGREVEADIEYVEYECGYATREDQDEPVSPCGADQK
jgi:hypothetical protein